MRSSGPKLYSAHDAANSYAYNQLLQAVNSVPSQLPKPRPANPSKSRIYLVRFHEAASSCFLTRLPMNLIRTLVTYNTLYDLLNLALTCKQLSRIMRDKYVVEGDLGYRDLLDASRVQELSAAPDTKVKMYETVRLRIVHINPLAHSFYALDTDSILEGALVRYNDSFQVLHSRPCIRDVSAVDVAGETLACANDSQLALSQPSALRIACLDPQPTLSVRFLGQQRLLVVLRAKAVQVFSASLMALSSIVSSPLFTVLYVPSVDKSVFATVDWTNTVRSYVIRGPQCVQLYAGQHIWSGHSIQAIWMLREVFGDTKVDYLIVWFEGGHLSVNEATLGHFRYVRLKDKTLICLSNRVEIFGIYERTRQFKQQKTLELPLRLATPSIVMVWKNKAVLMGPNYIVWAAVEGDYLVEVSRNEVTGCTSESVRVYGHYLLVQGRYRGEVAWTAVTNFAANAMIDRTRILEEAEKVLAEA